MSEWLDLMLEEINRKRRELQEARDEAARRAGGDDKPGPQKANKESD